MGKFKELRVWKDSMDLAIKVYGITNMGKFKYDHGLKEQIRRASVSIASNISEGDERSGNKQSVYFFNIAKASTAEVITQLNIAYEIGYINNEVFSSTEDQAEKIRASLKNLIKYRSKS